MVTATGEGEGKSLITIGVDLGGTSIRVGLFDATMKLLDSHRMETMVAAGPQFAVNKIAAVVDQLIKRHSGNGREWSVLGLGIGSPGPIDLRAGVLGELPNLPGWESFPLRAALAEETGLEVILESDANAAAIAEWKLGVGRQVNVKSMVVITLGTGVGSGFILNGQVWHGILGMGGEVGHSSIVPEGLLCSCGTRGCLEMYASSAGLVRLASTIAESNEGTDALRQLLVQPGERSSSDIAALADAGDQSANRLGFYLGLGVANLINTLDLPMILIGGGVANAWHLFAPAMFAAVREYSQIYRLVEPTQTSRLEPDRPFIGQAALGPVAGLLGAGLLPWRTERSSIG